MTNEERFEELMNIANKMADEVTDNLKGVVTASIAHQKMFTQLAAICKNQEKRIIELESRLDYHIEVIH